MHTHSSRTHRDGSITAAGPAQIARGYRGKQVRLSSGILCNRLQQSERFSEDVWNTHGEILESWRWRRLGPRCSVARKRWLPHWQQVAKPNSTINGVRVGTITYSYRSMPDQSAEATLRYVVDSGISQIEFMGGPVEAFAGAPQAAPVAVAAAAASRRLRAAGGPARSGGEAEGVAHVGIDGPVQGAAQDVQRRGRHDLRVEAVEPEHVGRGARVHVQRRGGARLHAHDARADRRRRATQAARRVRGEEEDLRRVSHASAGQHDRRSIRRSRCRRETWRTSTSATSSPPAETRWRS